MALQTEQQLHTDIAVAEETVNRQESLLARASDAHKAMELSATSFKESWSLWNLQAEAALCELRETRMAMNTEWSRVLAGCADVRKFFLSDGHAAEVARLREFVEIAERLKALQDCGFLDRVADVMLKLEGGAK